MSESKSPFKGEINLIPGDLLALRQKKREKYFLSVGLSITVLFFVVLYFYPEIIIRSYEHDLAHGKEIQDRVKNQEEQYKSLLSRKKECEHVAEVFKKIEKRTISIEELLNTFSSVLPRDIKIESFNLQGNERIDISFQVHNPVQVAELIVILNNLKTFRVENPVKMPLRDREEIVTFILYFN
ncbi:MAG: hypothetical protein C4554_03140 [Dethiobacter sp.]|jgi:hypothetical protein|nr:MAG: hypothetical protein C4554_03140 [Dethiobacter sp.]